MKYITTIESAFNGIKEIAAKEKENITDEELRIILKYVEIGKILINTNKKEIKEKIKKK